MRLWGVKLDAGKRRREVKKRKREEGNQNLNQKIK
jgi:hypothetical protein